MTTNRDGQLGNYQGAAANAQAAHIVAGVVALRPSPEGLSEMIRATLLHDIRALLGQMLDEEDLDVLLNDSLFRIAWSTVAGVWSTPSTQNGSRKTLGA